MKVPRVLLVNGSPKTDGNSAGLAGRLAKGVGGDVDAVDLYRERILACVACGACAGGGACPLDDAMEALLERLAAADALVFASPLHFTSLSAPLIAFIGRLQPFWPGPGCGGGRRLLPVKRRFGALAVTAGSEYRDMFRPARAVAAAAFKTLGVEFVGMAGAPNTDAAPAPENADALAAADALALRIREGLAERDA